MTIEIVEFRCPTCGHPIGEEEYKLACNTFDKKVSEACNERIQGITIEHQLEIRNMEKKHNEEIDFKVSQEIQVLLKQEKERLELDYNKKINEAKAIISEKNVSELEAKNREIEIVKSQLANMDEYIRNALEAKEEKHNQKISEYELKLSRIEGDNKKLVMQVEHLQSTLDSVSPEPRGTAGEKYLYDKLKKTFGQDILVAKKVGVEMPDVVQTIVLENGDKLSPPIAWDSETGDCITAKDIKQAKRYKEICNTDCSTIVSAKGITEEDSEGGRAGLIGYRDGILLVHPSVVVGVAKLVRASLIERSRLAKNNIGVQSKQAKLYEYITSQSRFRKMMERAEKKVILEDLIRRAEEYMKKSWSEQRKQVQSWFETDRADEETINGILQEGDCNEKEQGPIRD